MQRSILSCVAAVAAAGLTAAVFAEQPPHSRDGQLTQDAAAPPATQPSVQIRGQTGADTGEMGVTGEVDTPRTGEMGVTGTADIDRPADQPAAGVRGEIQADEPGGDMAADRSGQDMERDTRIQRDQDPSADRDTTVRTDRDRSIYRDTAVHSDQADDPTDRAQPAAARETPEEPEREHRIGSNKPHLQNENPEKPHLADK